MKHPHPLHLARNLAILGCLLALACGLTSAPAAEETAPAPARAGSSRRLIATWTWPIRPTPMMIEAAIRPAV